MLHILLLILKIIGILLLVIIALLLLLFLTVSFSPLKYRGEASCRGNPDTLCAYVKFHWLFRLISGEVTYRNGEADWRIRAAWKRIGDVEEEAAEKREAERTEEKSGKSDAESEPPEKDAQQSTEEPGKERNTEEEKLQSALDANEICKDPADQNPKPDEKKRGSEQETKKARVRTVPEKHRKNPQRKESFSERVEKYIKRIKYTFQSFCDKIRALKKKKDRIKAFVENETHRKAFVRATGELKRFFRFIRPKKMNLHIEFGCKNPEYTGYILAGISMIYPLIGEYTELQPDFERRVLKGKASIEGRFRIIYVLIIAWNLICDKNVRTTYRHIRRFKL